MWNLFLLLLITVSSECRFIEPKNGASLSRAVTDIINNFYANITPTVNFITASETIQSRQTVEDILNEIIKSSNTDFAFEVDEVNNLREPAIRKKSHNVILCDTLKSFKQIFTKLRQEIFEFEGFFLIVISQYEENLYETMVKIFESFWSRHIVNVNIMWSPAENDDDTLMYTFWPYTSFHCGEASPVQLNQYRVDKWLGRTNYFPNKVANLFGCPLHVATFPNAPFIIIDDHDGNVSGIDGTLLRVLSQRMNFKAEVKLVSDLWGDVDLNGTATGAIEMTMRGTVNMTLGYFASTPLRDYFMSPSFCYYTSNLVWMVPPGRLVSSLRKLVRPFQNDVWICFLLVLGVALFVTVVFKNPTINFIFGSNMKTPFFNIINVTLSGSLNKLPRRNFARSILIMFMFYCLVMQNSYKGGLFKFMQMTIREPEMKTTDEIIAKNFSFSMLSSSKGYLTELPKILEMSVFLNYSEYNSMLDQVINPDFKSVLLTSEDHLAYRNIKAFPNRFYQHASEIIFSNNLVVYMTKSSCLVHEVDQIIINLVKGGLIKTWAAHYIDKSFLTHKSSTKAVSLKMTQFWGSFELLLIGLAASFVMFAFELSFHKLKELKKQHLSEVVAT